MKNYFEFRKVIESVQEAGHKIDRGKQAIGLLDKKRAAKVRAIAKKYKLKVIEDAAQAHGSKIKKKYCGTFGDFGCFSFFPSKNLGSFGDAGCVVSNNRTLIEKIKKLRNHGKFSKNNFDVLGFNERLRLAIFALITFFLIHFIRVL